MKIGIIRSLVCGMAAEFDYSAAVIHSVGYLLLQLASVDTVRLQLQQQPLFLFLSIPLTPSLRVCMCVCVCLAHSQ